MLDLPSKPASGMINLIVLAGKVFLIFVFICLFSVIEVADSATSLKR
jgi:hypothetical protein